MSRRITSVMVGVAVYMALVSVLYILHKFAVPAAGQLFPLWYSSAELLVKAAMAVVPGFAAGWMFRHRTFSGGAMVGATGGALEVVVLAALSGVPFSQFGSRILVGAVATALASALTNSAGSVAGDFLRVRRSPAGREREASRRQHRRRSASSG